MYIRKVGSGFTFQFFDATGVPDHMATDPDDPDNTDPTDPDMPDPGSGYTAAQLAQMRAEQEKTIKETKFKIKMAEADYKIMQTEMSDGNVYAEFDGKVVSVLSEDEAKTQNHGPLGPPPSAATGRQVLEGTAARRHARRARAYIALVMVALAATLGVATYAWFTNNMKVNTNSVSVHSDTSKLALELGDADRGSWSQQGDASLASTASGAVTLYPVSTFDLNGFAACAQNNSVAMPQCLSRQKTTAPPSTTLD